MSLFKRVFNSVAIIFGLSIANIYAAYCQGQTVKGVVKDSAGQPVCAAIAVFYKADSSIAAQGITNEQGKFALCCDYSGSGRLWVRHIAYKSVNAEVTLPMEDTLQIVLNEQLQELEEVTVQGARPLVEVTKEGNLCYNVERLNAKSDVNRMLRRLPGVQSSGKSGITIDGKEAALYIDGRKQVMLATQAVRLLQSMPANSIYQVEVISIPGGQYDAAGPVLHLKTAKRKGQGYDVTLSGSGLYELGWAADGGANVYVMARKKNVMIHGMLDYYHDKVDRVYAKDSTVYSDGSRLAENSCKKPEGNTVKGMLNLLWELAGGHHLNLNLYGHYEKARENSFSTALGPDESKNADYRMRNRKTDDLWSGNIEYFTPDSLPYRLQASYGLVFGGSENDTRFTNYYPASNREVSLNTDPAMEGTQHTVKIDFDSKESLNKWKIKSGVRFDAERLEDNVHYEGTVTGGFNDNEFKADENILTVYSDVFCRIMPKWNVYAVLKGEHTWYDAKEYTSGDRLNDRYWRFLPYFYLNYRTKKANNFIIFALSSNRPGYFNMLPGKRYGTDYSYTVGNPALKPEKSYKFSFLGVYWSYLRVNFGYTRTRNLSGELLLNDDRNATVYSWQNYADRDFYYAHLTLPFALFGQKVWGYVTGTFDYWTLDCPRNGYVLPERNRFYANKLDWLVQYEITDNLSWNVSGNNVFKSRYPQYNQRAYWSVSSGMEYSYKRWNFTFDYDGIAKSYDFWQRKVYRYDETVRYREQKFTDSFFRFGMRWSFSGGEKMKRREKMIDNDINRFGK